LICAQRPALLNGITNMAETLIDKMKRVCVSVAGETMRHNLGSEFVWPADLRGRQLFENPQKTGQMEGFDIRYYPDSSLGDAGNVARGRFCFEGDGGRG
jgi:hypothetical protein